MSSQHKPSTALFSAFVLLVACASWFFNLDKAPVPPLSDTKSKPELTSIPKVSVQEDTLIRLIHAFLLKRNTDNPDAIKSAGKYFKIIVANAGDPVEFINNPELMDIKDQGFEIRKNKNGSIEATFPRLSESGIHYIELPTDILYRLLDKLTYRTRV